MKKVLVILTLTATMSVSCKKEADNVPLGTFKATIDGVAITFNISAKVSTVSVQNGYGIKIFGYKKDPSISGTDLQIIIVRPTPITAGTYIENPGNKPLVEMNYFYDLFFGAGVGYSGFHSAARPVKVNVTEISSTSIKGTFEGEIQGTGFSGETIKSQIINGVFHLSF
jgi:hypothetical protein